MNNQENYIFPKKSELKQISINEVYAKLPDLKNTTESKATTIGKWLAGWITAALSDGKIEENNILTFHHFQCCLIFVHSDLFVSFVTAEIFG